MDFDHGVNTAVNRLREILGDSADSPRFIETVPRKGYRFIAHVEVLSVPEALPAPVPVAVPDVAAVATAPAPMTDPLPARTVQEAVALPASAGLRAQTADGDCRGRDCRRLPPRPRPALAPGASVSPSSMPARQMRLAVLPFRNLSGDPARSSSATGSPKR